MTAKEMISKLHVGERVKCKLNGAGTHHGWFTGTIVYKDPSHYIINILRDGRSGGSPWTTTLTDDNCHLIKTLIGDWDE